MGWIYFDHSPIWVDDGAVIFWFPELTLWGANAGRRIVDQIDERILAYSQTSIAPSTIQRALKDLFQIFNLYQIGSKRERILTKLRTLLSGDMYGGQLGGLKISRQRFLILASMARCTLSYALAQALVEFLSENIYNVLHHEATYHLREWGLALNELRGLVHDPLLQQLLSHLTGLTQKQWEVSVPGWHSPGPVTMLKAVAAAQNFPSWPRRRLLHAPPVWGPTPRARSAPGFRQFHLPSPDWRMKALPSSAWVSPVTSPRLNPRMNDYFTDDEYEALQIEQNIQAAEVDELSERVQRLEQRY
jgi:hypothetical protein